MNILTKLLYKNQAKFVEKRHEVGDVHTFVFEPQTELNWQPGQYIDFHLGFQKTKHFTIASAPHEKTINITTRIFKKHSEFKESLLNLKRGQEIALTTPQGSLTLDDPKKNYVFIAGGIGITPFRAIIWDMSHRQLKTKATLLYAGEDGNMALLDELRTKGKELSGLSLKIIKDRHINKKDLEKLAKDNVTWLVSGPPSMVEAIEKFLKELKVSQKKIKTDYFLGYK